MAKKLRVIALFALLVVGATSMMALPDHEIEYIYYTDSSKSVECGYRLLTCSGTYSSGCRTSWYDVIHGPDC